MAQQVLQLLQMRAGVEMFKKTLNEGQAGDNVGLLLRGIKREDVLRGQVCLHHGCLQAQASICRLQLSMQQRSQIYDSPGRGAGHLTETRHCIQHAQSHLSVCKNVLADCMGIKAGSLSALRLHVGCQAPADLIACLDLASQHHAELSGFVCRRVHLPLVLLWGWTPCMPDSTPVRRWCASQTPSSPTRSSWVRSMR